jgi:hypothetical protein
MKIPAATFLLLALLLAAVPRVLAQGTVLPTDTVSLPAKHRGASYVKLNSSEISILDRLPEKLYMNFVNETSFRLETNPFQDPSKYQLLQYLLSGGSTSNLRTANQSITEQLSNTSANQQIFRENPNMTVGWQFTPRFSVYSNYFLIRDSLMHSTVLNSNTQSVGGGMQYDIPIGKRFDLQPNLQFRELFQTGQPNVFDYMPAITLTANVGRDTQVYVNSILQLEGLQPFVAPQRAISPFYTVGFQTTKGRWQFLASATFVQTFGKPFGGKAYLPLNYDSIICDLEVDRQLFRKFQGLQAFVRAEPVFNFHSSNAPSISGFDFRLYYGLRLSLSKPSLTGPMQQMRQELLQRQSVAPRP